MEDKGSILCVMPDNETRIHNEAVLKELKPGDLIRFYQDYSEHWAVYAGEDEKGDKTVIHWWKENAVASSPRIRITSFWICADKMIAEKGNSDCIHVSNVVKRAKEFMQRLEKEERTGEHKAYPDLFYNCEHFAKWCYYGLGGLDKKWCLSEADSVIDINRVKNVWEFVHGIFTNHTSDGQAIRLNVDVLGQLLPGDVIRLSRGLYEHWATYIGQDKDKTIPKSVIHWWDNDGASNSYIRIVPFWELAGNCKAEKFNSDHPDKVALTESEAVQRANLCIDKTEGVRKDIQLTAMVKGFHCSEDFAKWFYLKLMCKPRTKEPGNIKFVIPLKENWLCCKHEGFDRKIRFLLNHTLLSELEPELHKQLREGVRLEQEIHKTDPEFKGQKRIVQIDPCSIFTRRKNDETLEKLKPGDFIKFVKKSCNHWGVYIDVGTFIHWTAECHDTEPCRKSDGCTPCIEIGSVKTLKKAEKLEKLNREGRIIDRDQVVERVQALLATINAGEKNGEDYRDLFNNCEHFATWCHYGLGNKRLKISREDIEQIKDVRKFVQGEFSPIPWRICPKEGIHAYQMWQLSKSIADIGKKSDMGKAGSVFLPKSSAVSTSEASLPQGRKRKLDDDKTE